MSMILNKKISMDGIAENGDAFIKQCLDEIREDIGNLISMTTSLYRRLKSVDSTDKGKLYLKTYSDIMTGLVNLKGRF